MLYRLEDMLNGFRENFPSMCARMIGYKRINEYDILIKFVDGSASIYDVQECTIRTLPKDSNKMNELDCRKEFSYRLDKIMRRQGITQADLSAMTGLSQAQISNYMNCKSSPGLYALDRIAKALHCSVDEFRYDKYWI